MQQTVIKDYLKMFREMNIRPGTLQMQLVSQDKKKEVILINLKITIDPLFSPNWKAPQPFPPIPKLKINKKGQIMRGKFPLSYGA